MREEEVTVPRIFFADQWICPILEKRRRGGKFLKKQRSFKGKSIKKRTSPTDEEVLFGSGC
jgi:hypothetical protein